MADQLMRIEGIHDIKPVKGGFEPLVGEKSHDYGAIAWAVSSMSIDEPYKEVTQAT